MFTIDWLNRGIAPLGQIHDQLAGDDECFFVGERDRLPSIERGPGAGEACRADDGGYDHVRFRIGRQFAHAIFADEQAGARW